MKEVIVSNKDSIGKDEWWCTWYKCPNCKNTSIATSFTYCPDCGTKLKWEL